MMAGSHAARRVLKQESALSCERAGASPVA
jgi:hypothetical protein